MSRIELIKKVQIKNGEVLVDKQLFFNSKITDTAAFFKELYKEMDISYSKFYKMDLLSKSGFLAAELLLSELNSSEKENMAIVLGNVSSSLNTDVNYQQSIKDIPSPALFVYTLPNIVIGEISIRHKIYGEHMFFIQPSYDRDFMLKYIKELFESNEADVAMFGWVEVDEDGIYEVCTELCKKITN